jgi:hypothetical protein
MKMLAPAQKIRSFRLVTTTNALNRVGQLDVHAEVVRIQFQFVVGDETGILLHIHAERGDRAVERQLPMTIAIWMGFEGNGGRGGPSCGLAHK